MIWPYMDPAHPICSAIKKQGAVIGVHEQVLQYLDQHCQAISDTRDKMFSVLQEIHAIFISHFSSDSPGLHSFPRNRLQSALPSGPTTRILHLLLRQTSNLCQRSIKIIGDSKNMALSSLDRLLTFFFPPAIYTICHSRKGRQWKVHP